MHHTDLIEALTALGVIVILFGLLPWLFLHYRERRLRLLPPVAAVPAPSPAFTPDPGAHDTRDLMTLALSLQHRVDSLERLLDAEAPGWRKRHD